MTGGASGTGAAIARAFIHAGAHVHVCDLDPVALDRLAAATPGITTSAADASIERDVDLVFDDVRGALGGLDLLVNNVGIAGPTAAIDAIDISQWDRTVAVNLTSQFLFARRAVPLLRDSTANPSIIAMSSAAGRQPYPFRAPYAATQWAIVGMTKSLAIELGPQGVRVNAILAGSIDGVRPVSPRRTVVAEDVAATALYLSSPAARNLTGQAISVTAWLGFSLGHAAE